MHPPTPVSDQEITTIYNLLHKFMEQVVPVSDQEITTIYNKHHYC